MNLRIITAKQLLLLLAAKFSYLCVAVTRNYIPSEVRVVTHDKLPFVTVTTHFQYSSSK